MKPSMDLERNGSMSWFFNNWVYGNAIPSYKLEYSIEREGTKFIAAGTLTQSGVSDDFVMRVPIYADYGKKSLLAGAMAIAGNHSGPFRVELPSNPESLKINANFDVLTDHQESVRRK